MDQQLFDAATQNFNLPHDVVQLPTGGIFYKSKKKSVKVGYLTAADENLILGSINGKEGVVMSLLRSKIYEHDIKPEELLDADIQAILIFLRNTSFGSEYTLNLVDPKTNKTFPATITLDELNFKRCDHKPDENGLFSTSLPKSGPIVKLKPLTFYEELELDKLSEQYPVGRIVPKVTWRLNKMIQEIDGNTDRNFISQFIETMPISDSKYLRKFLDENTPGLDLNRTTIAPSGEKVSFDITFGVEFFRIFF